MRDPLATDDLTRRGVAFDVALAVVFSTLSISIHWSQSVPAGVAAALIGLGLAVRRLAPSLMIMLALVSAAVQVATYEIAVFAALGYSVLFYTLGTHPDRRVRWGSLAVGLAGCVVAGWTIPRAYAASLPADEGPSVFYEYIFGFIAATIVVIGGWTVGFIRHQRRAVEASRVAETIAELERRRLLDLYAEQAERTRLARDMHDVVAHSLAVVVAQAEGARFTFDRNPESARDALGVIAGTARDALTDVRGLLDQLRRDDIGAATDDDRRQLFERMRSAGMTLGITETGTSATADTLTTQVVYRILTEALTNALKYGDLSRSVDVELEWTDGCRLRVRNHIAEQPLSPGGAAQGIIGMSERAALVGGRLSSWPAGAGEWLLQLYIPNRTKEIHA